MKLYIVDMQQVKDEDSKPFEKSTPAGCQSTSHEHSQCYGELWQCDECRRWVCCADGTDNHPELCDECWAKMQGGMSTC